MQVIGDDKDSKIDSLVCSWCLVPLTVQSCWHCILGGRDTKQIFTVKTLLISASVLFPSSIKAFDAML